MRLKDGSAESARKYDTENFIVNRFTTLLPTSLLLQSFENNRKSQNEVKEVFILKW